MNPRERRIPDQEELQIKERLSDKEMGNLLAAFGNHEAKAITLLLMRQGVIYRATDLRKMIINAQGKTPSWRIRFQGSFNYCEYSLVPGNLVTREITDQNLGMRKTEYGEKADTLAALLLDFSFKHEKSLYQLFGPTNSPEIVKNEEGIEFRKRAPLTRLKIFRAILSSQLPIQESDLEYMTGERNLAYHLGALSRSNIITYQSTERDTPYSFYRLSPNKSENEPDSYRPGKESNRGEIKLTSDLYKLLLSNPDHPWTSEEIVHFFVKNGVRRKNLQSLVSSILGYLRRERYVEINGKFSFQTQSEISLTDQQRTSLNDLLSIIDNLQNQDQQTLERGRDLVEQFRSGKLQQQIRELMQKAKENSPNVSKLPLESTGTILLSIIRQHPFTKLSEIRDILDKKYGRRLSTHYVSKLLRNLRLNGEIIGEKEKINIRWRVNPQISKAS